MGWPHGASLFYPRRRRQRIPLNCFQYDIALVLRQFGAAEYRVFLDPFGVVNRPESVAALYESQDRLRILAVLAPTIKDYVHVRSTGLPC